MDGNQTHDLDPAHLYADGKFPHPTNRVTELRYHKLVAPVKGIHELFPLRTHQLMVSLFLNHLYTAEFQHPFLIGLV